MEESEDINFLSGDEWIGIQKKTFTNWSNSHLRKKNVKIDDLYTDFRDGKYLSLLLHIISGDTLPRAERGNMRLHKVSNVSKCLDFVQKKGVKLVGVGAEEIVDGNEKMTLGMIWTIILRFALHDVGDSSMSARDGLLLWCKQKTKPYRNVKITNFSTSWKDGLAFCALIHRHRPELIDYDSLSRESPEKNLETAFSIAEKHLDIPRMLDIEDMLMNVPDEKSVMTYVSSYYQCFATSHEGEAAIKRLANALDLMNDLHKLKAEFEESASNLKAWIEAKIPEMADRNVKNDDLDSFKQLTNDFDNYKGQEKPKWEEEKNRMENLLKTIKTLHRINNLPEYIPPEELDSSIIDGLWKTLEEEERRRHEWIRDQLMRHRNIDHLLKKFDHKCNMHEDFVKTIQDEFTVEGLSDDISRLMAASRKHEALKSELDSRDSRLGVIENVYSQLEQLKYSNLPVLTQRYNDIKQNWKNIHNQSDSYGEELKKRLEIAEKLDKLRAKYAKLASLLNTKIEDILDEVGDAYLVNSISDVEAVIQNIKKLEESVGPLQQQYGELMTLQKEIDEISTDKNPYVRVNADDLSSHLNSIGQLINSKMASLDGESAKFQKHKELVNKLEAKVAEIDKWQQNEINKLNFLEGSLEEQKVFLKTCDEEIHAFYEPRLGELVQIIRQVNETGIDTDVASLSTLESGFRKMLNLISNNMNVIENSILLRDSSALSEDTMIEYKKLFNNLDKQRIGFLDTDNFRNFLVATGHKVTPTDPNGEKEFAHITSKVDPEDTKKFFFEDFLNYIAESSKQKHGAEDMIESFKAISAGKPYITVDQLRRDLPQHADKCIELMLPYEGEDSVPGALDYLSFAADLYGSSDL